MYVVCVAYVVRRIENIACVCCGRMEVLANSRESDENYGMSAQVLFHDIGFIHRITSC